MKPENANILFVSINILVFIFLALLVYVNSNKRKKLSKALDHFYLTNNADAPKEEYIKDTLRFKKTFSKNLKLFEAVKNTETKKYYEGKIAEEVGLRLLENGAIRIEFKETQEKDFILTEVDYLLKDS